MNSYSQDNFNHDCKSNNCYKDNNHPIPGPALLRTNKGSLGSITINPEANDPITQPVEQAIASVTVDTACFRCPKILIDFAGILTATALDIFVDATYTFTLFKTCKGSAVRLPVETFTFSQHFFSLAGSDNDSRTLKFEFAPCDDSCEDCCTYTLELTRVTENLGLSFSLAITGVISALVVENCAKPQ